MAYASEIRTEFNLIMAKKRPLAIVVHGGAGPDSDRIKSNQEWYVNGIKDAVEAGYKILEEGGTAVDAVEAAVKSLEDNLNFNAGRGSALNSEGEVEMDAAIMSGKDRASGAVTMLRNVKNPISLAKAVMLNTSYRFLGDMGALKYAKQIDIKLAPNSYFVTEHQYDAFDKKRKEEFNSSDSVALKQINQRFHGTVGAVALDHDGNVASATSTGGIENQLSGRIGDSCIIGAGCFADNKIAAISATGDGEIIMKQVVAHDIAAAIEYKNLNLQEACDFIVHQKDKLVEGDIGVIAIDSGSNIGIAFNSERMHRGWKTSENRAEAKIYPDGGQGPAEEKEKEKKRQNAKKS